jgi:thiosulfate reductase cytochrome b subunit
MLPSRTRTARVLTTHGPARPTHPLPIRIMHWVGAMSILCMMLSGWAIYNASPSLPFMFPRWMTLGGWLAGGIAWHISVMWVLFVDGAAYCSMASAAGIFAGTSARADRAQ